MNTGIDLTLFYCVHYFKVLKCFLLLDGFKEARLKLQLFSNPFTPFIAVETRYLKRMILVTQHNAEMKSEINGTIFLRPVISSKKLSAQGISSSIVRPGIQKIVYLNIFTGNEYSKLKVFLEKMPDQAIETTPLNVVIVKRHVVSIRKSK